MALNTHALRFVAANSDLVTVQLNGTSNKHETSLAGLDKFFWEAWVKVGAGCTSSNQRAYVETQPNGSIRFSAAPTRLGQASILRFELAVVDGTNPTPYTYTVFNGWDDRWHHIGFSADIEKSEYSIYYDGNRVASGNLVGGGKKTYNNKEETIKIGQANSSATPTNTTNKITIGGYGSGSSAVYWDGKIDNIRILNKTATAQSLSGGQGYNFGDQYPNPEDEASDLIEEWRFNEGAGYFFTDSTTTGSITKGTVSGTGTDGLRIRSGPGTNTAVLAVIAEGTQVTVTGSKTATNWYPVSYRSYVGYCYASYLQITQGSGTASYNAITYGSVKKKKKDSDTEYNQRNKAELRRAGTFSSALWIGETSDDYDRPFLAGGEKDTHAPSRPYNLQTTAITQDSFTVNWSPSWDDVYVQRYELTVATDAKFTQSVLDYSSLDVGRATTYDVIGLSPNKTYYWRVRAVDAESNTSHWASSTAYRRFKVNTATTRINRCLNPSFENTTAGWDAFSESGKVPSIVANRYTGTNIGPENTVAGIYGDYYLTFSATSNDSMRSGIKHRIPWTRGKRMAGNFWVRGSGTISVQVETLNNNLVLGISTLNLFATGLNTTTGESKFKIDDVGRNAETWYRVDFSYTPNTAAMNHIGLQISHEGSSDFAIDIDGVMIEETNDTFVGLFFDGNQSAVSTAKTHWVIYEPSTTSDWMGYIPKPISGNLSSEFDGLTTSVQYISATAEAGNIENQPIGVTTPSLFDRQPPGDPRLPNTNNLPSSEEIGTNGFSAKWLAPLDNYSDILGYELQVGLSRNFGTASAIYIPGYEKLVIYTPYLQDVALGIYSQAVTGLKPNTSYSYRVRAFDSNNNYSSWSSTLTIVTDIEQDLIPPTPVTVYRPQDITHDQFVATWDEAFDNVGVASYEVQLSRDPEFTTLVAGYPKNVGNVLSYQVSDLLPETSYYVRVAAKDASGNLSSFLEGSEGYVEVTTPRRPESTGGVSDWTIITTNAVQVSSATPSASGTENNILALDQDKQLLLHFSRGAVAGKFVNGSVRFQRISGTATSYKFSFWPINEAQLPMVYASTGVNLGWPSISYFTATVRPYHEVIKTQPPTNNGNDIFEIDITPILTDGASVFQTNGSYFGFRMRAVPVTQNADGTWTESAELLPFRFYGTGGTDTNVYPRIVVSSLSNTALRLDSVVSRPSIKTQKNLFINPTLDSTYEVIPINNGTFTEDISKWWKHSNAVSLYTYTFTRDSLIYFDEYGGSAKINITNSLATQGDKSLFIENETAIPFTLFGIKYGVRARVATSNINLKPRVAVRWYKQDGSLLKESVDDTAWTPMKDEWAQRTLELTVSPSTFTGLSGTPSFFKVAVYIESAAANTTGTVFIDEIAVGTSAASVALGVTEIGDDVTALVSTSYGYDIGPTTRAKSLYVKTQRPTTGVKLGSVTPNEDWTRMLASAGTINLFENPSFESNYGLDANSDTMLVAGNQNASRISDDSYVGSYSLKFNLNSSGAQSLVFRTTAIPDYEAAPSKTYVASFSTKTSGQFSTVLRAFDSSYALISSSGEYTFTSSSNWSRFDSFTNGGDYSSISGNTITTTVSNLVPDRYKGKLLKLGNIYGTVSGNTTTQITVTSWNNGTPSSTGKWVVEDLSMSVTIPVGKHATYLELEITKPATNITSQALLIDALQVEEVPSTNIKATAYCDGDRGEGNLWWGRPNESISYRNGVVAHLKLLVPASVTPNFKIWSAVKLNTNEQYTSPLTIINTIPDDARQTWVTVKTWPVVVARGSVGLSTSYFVQEAAVIVTAAANIEFYVDGVALYDNYKGDVLHTGSSFYSDWAGSAFMSVTEHPAGNISSRIYYTGDINANAKITGLIKIPNTYADFQEDEDIITTYSRSSRSAVVAVPDVIRWNEISNPSFETGTYGWSATGDSVSYLVSPKAISGSSVGVWKVGTSTGATVTNQEMKTAELIRALPNERWSFSISAQIKPRTTSGQLAPALRAVIKFYDKNYVQIGQTIQDWSLSYTSWTTCSVTAVSPARAAWVSASIKSAINAVSEPHLLGTDEVYLDCALLYRGPLGRTFKTGDDELFFWEGKPHSSRTLFVLKPQEAYDIKFVAQDFDGIVDSASSLVKTNVQIPANPSNYAEFKFNESQATIDYSYIELRVPFNGDASRVAIDARYRRTDRYERTVAEWRIDPTRQELIIYTDGLRANTSYVFEVKIVSGLGVIRGEKEWISQYTTAVPPQLDTALADGTISFGGFTLNGPDSKYFWVTSHDSFSMPQRRVQIENLPRMDGGVELQSYWGTKTIKISGGVWGETSAELYENLNALRAALAEKRQKLRIDTLTNRADYYIATCSEFSVTEQAGETRTGLEWSATFECADPFLYRASPSSQSFNIISSLPVSQTTQFFSDDQTFTINNLGSVDTLPVITLQGDEIPGEFSIVVYNDTTSDRIMPKTTFTETAANTKQTIVINSATMQCTKDGEATLIDYAGTFPRLAPGANQLRISLTDLKQSRINLAQNPSATALIGTSYDVDYTGENGIYQNYAVTAGATASNSLITNPIPGVNISMAADGATTSGNYSAKIVMDSQIENQGIVFRTSRYLGRTENWDARDGHTFSGSAFIRTDDTASILDLDGCFIRIWYADRTIQPTTQEQNKIKSQRVGSQWNRIVLPSVTSIGQEIDYVELVLSATSRSSLQRSFFVDNVQIIESNSTLVGNVARLTLTVAYQERFI